MVLEHSDNTDNAELNRTINRRNILKSMGSGAIFSSAVFGTSAMQNASAQVQTTMVPRIYYWDQIEYWEVPKFWYDNVMEIKRLSADLLSIYADIPEIISVGYGPTDNLIADGFCEFELRVTSTDPTTVSNQLPEKFEDVTIQHAEPGEIPPKAADSSDNTSDIVEIQQIFNNNDAMSTQESTPCVKGGDTIYPENPPGVFEGHLTSGGIWYRGGVRFIPTVAHGFDSCDGNPDINGETVYLDDNEQTKVGEVTDFCWNLDLAIVSTEPMEGGEVNVSNTADGFSNKYFSGHYSHSAIVDNFWNDETIWKVGATTGLEYGDIEGLNRASNHWWCQNSPPYVVRSDLDSAGGDSGAPTFGWENGELIYYGLHVDSNDSTIAVPSYYSYYNSEGDSGDYDYSDYCGSHFNPGACGWWSGDC